MIIKSANLFVLFMLAIMDESRSFPTTMPLDCRSDYEDVPEIGCYRLYKRFVSWQDAKRACELDNTRLAVPNTRAELQALGKMHERAKLGGNFQAWLGIHHSNNSWRLLDGRLLGSNGFTGWMTGEPTDNPGCAIVLPNGLYDRECSINSYYICEQ